MQHHSNIKLKKLANETRGDCPIVKCMYPNCCQMPRSAMTHV